RRAALLDIARHEYRDFGRLGALSETLRISHRLAVERGQLDRAIDMLARAFALDLASAQRYAIDEDLALFGVLGVLLGQIEASPQAERPSKKNASPLSPTTSVESFRHAL